MNQKKITLYHANWCGHCQTFKETWKAMKPILDQHNIKHEEFEETQNQEVMAQAGIEGYPTIRITMNGNTADYNGPRDVQSVLNYLGIQLGGGNVHKNDPSYYKYIKYKKKYLELKEKCNNIN